MNKKQISSIIIAIVVTAFVTYLLIPSKEVEKTRTIIQADTGRSAERKVDQAISNLKEMQGDIGWLKKMLKLAQNQTPINGAVSNPATSPIKPIPPTPADSGKKPPALYAYDFPLSMMARKNKIQFLTINPYLQYKELPYAKTYEFDRPVNDFDFVLAETQSSDNLDGIKMRSQTRFFSFDGITAGAGAMFPKNFYALLEIKFSMYERLHIDPRLTSAPEAGIELKYDILK